MSILLTARQLGHAFAARPLFESVSFTLSDGDRVGLIGPNGAGKSTLLRILAGEITAERGELVRRGALRVGYVPQTAEFQPGDRVRDAVRRGFAQLLGTPPGAAPHLDWQAEAKLEEVLARLELSAEIADAPVHTLSGGYQKRVALARALAIEPDLLLLDEPTNHLDVESILWLERLLGSASFATVTITHDRYFLQHVSRRILELDRRNEGGLLDVAGDYATYLERKADAMQAQEKQEQAMRNTLRRETEWLRRGPAARTTKQEARIERAAELADNVSELAARNRVRRAEIDLEATGRKTRRLVEAQGLGMRYGDKTVFSGVDLLLGRGARIALMGPNGSGKSTLLRALIGTEPPSEGVVKRAADLQIQVFEQQRESLDPEATVADSVAPGGDMVDFRGSRLHRYGYLERFLFRSEHMQMRVGNLSGGEQSRLLIARLMLRPADVLVLDEPTNDLDFETLDVLQEALVKLDAAVLLVSHDRYFVDQVATQILGFHTAPDELGQVSAFADLAQWQTWSEAQREAALRAQRGQTRAQPDSSDAAAEPAPPTKRKKLSYKEQRDWDTIEQRIQTAEEERDALLAESNRPEVASNAQRQLEIHAQLERLTQDIDTLYARWAELEALQS